MRKFQVPRTLLTRNKVVKNQRKSGEKVDNLCMYNYAYNVRTILQILRTICMLINKIIAASIGASELLRARC